MKKRIGLILPTKPEDGGQHQYAQVIVECLLEKADINYNLVALCGTSFWRKWCKKAGIKFLGYPLPTYSSFEKEFNYKHPFASRLYYTYMTPFGRIIRDEKIDILLSVHQGTFLANYKVKLISPVHDLMHRYEAGFPEVRGDFKEREVYMKSLAKYATCILVDSKLGKRQFEESYFKSYARKTHIISLPFVVPKHILNTSEEYIDVPNKYVFYPAQFWKHKNHINLVKAIKILKETISDVHLVLVGSEKNNYREVKQFIEDNELDKQVTILGFVSDENITYLYRHALGMIMPSYFGPTNIPPLEAMALGCPVAVSNKYAMPEQVGRAGLLFNPDSPEEIADCIKRLWTDEVLRHKLQKLGYKRVQKWTKCEFGEKLFRIIDAV